MEQQSQLILHDFLPYQLSVLANQVSTLLSTLYTERFNITIPQWRAIAMLGERTELTATEIARQTVMDKVAVSRAVHALIERHLVERRASQQDGRLAYLRLTEAGHKIYQEIIPLALEMERKLQCNLSQNDLRTWAHVQATIQHNLDHIIGEPLT